MKKLLAALGVVLLISGCAVNNNVWYKANASQEVFAQDRYACLQQAQQPNSTAYYGDYGGLLAGRQYTAQAGMVTSNPLFTGCMNSKGWSWMDQKAVPGGNRSPAAQQADSQSAKSRSDAVYAQMAASCKNPDYAAYYAKTFCSAPESTLAMMSDKSKINAREKEVLNAWSQAYDKLLLEANDLARQYGSAKDKQIILYYDTVSTPASQKNRLDLYDGKITWGDYNRRRKEINDAIAVERKRIFQ